jgi:hypothetical protein
MTGGDRGGNWSAETLLLPKPRLQLPGGDALLVLCNSLQSGQTPSIADPPMRVNSADTGRGCYRHPEPPAPRPPLTVCVCEPARSFSIKHNVCV